MEQRPMRGEESLFRVIKAAALQLLDAELRAPAPPDLEALAERALDQFAHAIELSAYRERLKARLRQTLAARLDRRRGSEPPP